MNIPSFFAGSITAKEITIGFGGIAIKGLAAAGGTAIIVGTGVAVGIAVSTGGVYVLVKNYNESKKKNM